MIHDSWFMNHESPIMKRNYTLSFDIGGSSIKAAVLDPHGHMVSEHMEVDTPKRPSPERLIDVMVELAKPAHGYQRISVGFPGIVLDNVVYSFPMSASRAYKGFRLGTALRKRLRRPVRVINDADMHGLGVISGHGVELVITLGTGLGTALYIDGRIGPSVQFTPSPGGRAAPRGGEYGKAAMRRVGRARWNKRVARLIDVLRYLTNFDHLYIGGGNADKLTIALPKDVAIVDNTAAIVGGVRLWQWSGR
jgi:polyphosphate glucokinase